MNTSRRRIALLDPVEEVAYSRPARRAGKYREDAVLQALLNDKGLDYARQYARRNYGGVYIAAMAD